MNLASKNWMRVSAAFGLLAAFGFIVAIAGVTVLRETELNEHIELSATSDLRFRVAELEKYRDQVAQDLNWFASSRAIQNAFLDFSESVNLLGAKAEELLRQHYIENNPYPIGEKHKLDQALDGSEFSRVHALYHATFRVGVDYRNYYDLLLVRPDGRIVYTVSKEQDFPRSVYSELLGGTALRDVFDDSLNQAPGQIVTREFSSYAPSAGQSAQFVGIPSYLHGEIIGVVIVQLRLDPFQQAMWTDRSYFAGLKCYVVSTNGKSLVDPGVTVAAIAAEAQKGASGAHRTRGGDGNEIYAAYTQFDWFGLTWAVVTELDYSFANRRKYAGVVPLTLLGAFAVAVGCILGWLFGARDGHDLGDLEAE